jgi:mono/diheme cytochrome c family protein
LRRPVSGRASRLALAAALIVNTAFAACSRDGRSPEQATVDGAALYAQACAKCHAADGTGGLPTVPNGPRPVDLTADEWQRSRSDAEVTAAIRNGRGAMPPFENVLTDEQITGLTAHVRKLKRP